MTHSSSLPLFLLFVFLAAGCDGLNGEGKALQPGALSLARISSESGTDNTFELGELKNTKPYNFFLTNKGETDIFGVTIESSNTGFVVEPALIPILHASTDLGLEQALQVMAIHGTDPSGLGPAELLPMGVNETQLRIRGQTTDASRDTIHVDLRATLQVNAQLADIEIYDSNGLVQLDAPAGTVLGAIAPWPITRYTVADGNVRLLNTGNVDVQVRIYRRTGTNEYEEIDVSLAPSEENTVERARELVVVRVDANRTITDAARLPIQQDGLIYIACDIDHSPPPDPPPPDSSSVKRHFSGG